MIRGAGFAENYYFHDRLGRQDRLILRDSGILKEVAGECAPSASRPPRGRGRVVDRLKRRFARIALLLGTFAALVLAFGADAKWH